MRVVHKARFHYWNYCCVTPFQQATLRALQEPTEWPGQWIFSVTFPPRPHLEDKGSKLVVHLQTCLLLSGRTAQTQSDWTVRIFEHQPSSLASDSNSFLDFNWAISLHVQGHCPYKIMMYLALQIFPPIMTNVFAPAEKPPQILV